MRKIWILCLLLLNACAGPAGSTPASTPVLFNVAVTPAMRPFVEVLHTCATAQSEFVININEVPATSLDIKTDDLLIRLGGTPGNVFTAPIGEEALILIVNANNPVLTIPVDVLTGIFTGRVTGWADVGGEQQPIQVWVYPDGDDTRELFDSGIFPDDNLTPNALIAPNPRAMLEAIGDDPFAIGYVPQAWLAIESNLTQIRPLNINQKLVEKLHQPVYAFSRAEPGGLLRQLLVCLQSARQ